MRTSAILLLMVLPTELPAQGFTSDAARAAQKKYEEATAAAREAYAIDLKEAAKVVLEAGDVEEGKTNTNFEGGKRER